MPGSEISTEPQSGSKTGNLKEKVIINKYF